ncbi:MAG: D-alanyl-D-alanine carboxypeptidase/D-alanyl-D-alanine-endopeptidase [Bacteroidales bacterium]|jgi:D-alanyl-D-alanine carboxypeptidase/D-alanyl-D-alanine-endopeptidase (penicillin-binding protein 4)|nr:D-alanyl-D-alanine carboxypeptidase/D-alanyl-D-alanine-endopeptidase [Bacteroidales bacterium]MDD3300520.1 D-alanyl-D-alanine carboxypeptidase/D-alanyl-D-alanine-endopeptidase [Bacteroidales bacterium]MDD3843199.1 D-alanyl-D-alanine carboxypeptidase/D-alanyl-D-alanine-endopeptidase [Bacteroidales bacterium]
MKQTLSFLIISLYMLFPNVSLSQNNIQKYIENLKKDTLFVNSATAIMVMDAKGKTIASWNPDMPLLTASTMKTITTGVALKVLGHDFQFKTKIAHTGFIENGVLYGDLYIVGGADPTLASKDTLGTPADTLFMEWTAALEQKGIKRINGNIVADDRYFEHEIVPVSWAWSNLGPSYGSGTSGLSFAENLQDFTFIPGINLGDDVVMKNVFPEIPGMEYNNKLLTSGSITRNRSSFYTSDLTKEALFKGTLPAGKDSVLITVSNKFPHLSCAYEFKKYLDNKGIYSKQEILDAKEFNSAGEYELTIIHETLSAPLYKIVNVTNRISNNFYAETLLKAIGKKVTGVGSYDSATVAVKRVLQEMDVNTKGLTQEDGSGLSRQNYVSPRFFCNYYSAMEKTDVFPYFFNSLAVPGGPGTLENVLRGEDDKHKKKIHAKSGSLANVRCYAGYVETKRGELLYFAILSNNFAARTAQMQVGIEGFLNELTKY